MDQGFEAGVSKSGTKRQEIGDLGNEGTGRSRDQAIRGPKGAMDQGIRNEGSGNQGTGG